MRKKERAITDRAEIDAILAMAKIVRVAFAVKDEPYIVPLSLGFDPTANAVYFHTAVEGRKIDFIAANPRVCFEVEGRVRIKAGDERGCSWGILYESVIGRGTIREIVDAAEQAHALRCIMRQQSGRNADWTFADRVLQLTRIWAIEIGSVTGKRSGPPQGGPSSDRAVDPPLAPRLDA
jgi:nitroimidazol reductase NimA-like FMN-containing flavoprotein (pyridoxamine 5'-phosphate oxidase superfamily)